MTRGATTHALPPSSQADPRPPVVTSLDAVLPRDRVAVMGILNLTPDSFSDGGKFVDPAIAIGHAQAMVAQGVDIIDVGAESTRPYGGLQPVTAEQERARLEAVLPAVIALGKPVSIDSMKAEVVDWALGRGAMIANDVWGLQRDPDMAPVVARHGVPVIVMHNRDAVDPAIDILADIMGFFERSISIAERAGIRRDQVVLDPGIGFGKTPEQSIRTIAHLRDFTCFGLRLLMGLSRKRFIASLGEAAPDRRIGGSIAGMLLSAEEGADIVRVHDVEESVQALRVARAIRSAR